MSANLTVRSCGLPNRFFPWTVHHLKTERLSRARRGCCPLSNTAKRLLRAVALLLRTSRNSAKDRQQSGLQSLVPVRVIMSVHANIKNGYYYVQPPDTAGSWSRRGPLHPYRSRVTWATREYDGCEYHLIMLSHCWPRGPVPGVSPWSHFSPGVGQRNVQCLSTLTPKSSCEC